MAYAPDGSLLSAHNDGKVRQWEGATHKFEGTFPLGEQYNVSDLMLSPDGQTLAASNSSAFQLWDVPSGRKLRTLSKEIAVAGFSPDGKSVAVGTADGIEIRALSDDKLIATFVRENWGGFGADGAIITQLDGKLRFRRLGNPNVEREIEIPDPFRKKREQTTVSTLANIVITNGFFYTPKVTISPDGLLAVSQFVDGTLGVWDTRTGTMRRLLRGFNSTTMGGDVSAIAFSRDSQRLAVGSRSGEAAIWNVSLPKP